MISLDDLLDGLAPLRGGGVSIVGFFSAEDLGQSHGPAVLLASERNEVMLRLTAPDLAGRAAKCALVLSGRALGHCDLCGEPMPVDRLGAPGRAGRYCGEDCEIMSVVPL